MPGYVQRGGLALPGPLHQAQYPPRGLVKHRLGQVTRGDRVDDGPVADAEVRRHLQVKSCGERGDPVVDRAPVGHDQPVETPLATQHLGQ